MNGHPEELLSAYVDGELESARCVEIAEHLKTCAACREMVESLRTLAGVAGSAPPDEITTRRFVAENRKRREEATRADRRAAAFPGGRLVRPLFALAAAVIVAITLFAPTKEALDSMFHDAAGEQSMGQNQAALSAGIY